MANKKKTRRSTRRDRSEDMNRNSRVESRVTGTGSVRTETVGRDKGTLVASVVTNPRNNSTSVYVGRQGASFILSGTEARTIYRVLQRHYDEMGKNTYVF